MPASKTSLTAIDLFSGCGGLSLGLQNAGYRVIAAVENEPIAGATYQKNHPSTLLLQRDIRSLRPAYLRKRLGMERGQLDLLAGCPPCQGFSRLWTMNGSYRSDDPINDLVFEFTKFVKAFMPKAIMMENVPALANDHRLARLNRSLRHLGYLAEARVCDATDYGVPQRRRRMILVALRGRHPVFAQARSATTTVREAIAGLHEPGQGSDPLHDYPVVRSASVMRRIKSIPKDGGSRSDLPSEEQLKCHVQANGFYDVYGRMAWRAPSPTITGGCINPSKGRFLHPTQDRAITLREAALLQGFPRDYYFDMSRGRYHAAQMIGNAFPPHFAEHHARRIKRALAADP